MMTIAELGSSAAWAVGAAGAGAAGNANIEAANNGTIGRIRVEEYYGPAQPAAVMAAIAAAQAAAFAGGP